MEGSRSTRGSRRWCAVASSSILERLRLFIVASLALLSPPVMADMMPSDSHLRVYRYTFANLAEFPDHLVIAYPVVCGFGGGSYAGTDLRENPQLSDLLDYDVVLAGRARRPGKYCRDTRLYVVEAKGWSMQDVVGAPGRGSDEGPTVKVEQLEKLHVAGRAKFFLGKHPDRRVHPTGHVLEPWSIAPDSDPVREIDDVFRLERSGDAFAVRGERVTYVYGDASSETLRYTDAARPAPSGTGTSPTEPVAPTVAMPSAPADAAPAAVPAPIPASTPTEPRWPWLVGVCGVIVVLGVWRLRRAR